MKKVALALSIITLTLTLIHLFTPPTHAFIPRDECVDGMDPSVNENLCKFSYEGLGSTIAGSGVHVLGGETTSGTLISNGATSSVMAWTLNLVTDPPIKSSEYVADVLNNTGIVQPAYAQGIGFTALSPVLSVWKAFRNLAYFLFIIIFVVVGFMIMFRAQLNPQTVVTVQAALPKMVLSLVLITFSYAIAGFVIDLIYLITFVVTELLQAFGILAEASISRDVIFSYSIFRIGISYLIAPGETAGAAANAVSNIVTGALGLPSLLDWLTDSLAYLIIGIVILIAMFRTLFALVLAWIGIIISVIFAPLILLINAMPGANTFSAWIRSLVANALVFPAVGIMLLIGAALVGGEAVTAMGITETADVGYNEGVGWVPPLVTTNISGPSTGVNAVRAIIGLGIIMILPEVIKLVKEIMGVKEGGIGAAITGQMQQATGYGQRAGTILLGKSQEEQYGRKGLLRRAPLPKSARFTKEGITLPGWPFGG